MFPETPRKPRFSVFSEIMKNRGFLKPPKWRKPESGAQKCGGSRQIIYCLDTRSGPQKRGFWGFWENPCFGGTAKPGIPGAESGTAPNPVQIRCTKMGVFLTPRKYGFFGFPENPRILRNSSMVGTAKISEANGGGNFDRKPNQDVPFRLRRIMNLDS
jgi:hypothetical protein